MIPKSAIEKAIEGGWMKEVLERPLAYWEYDKLTRDYGDTVGVWFRWSFRHPTAKTTSELSIEFLAHEIVLDPSFWQALGKALGWDEGKITRAGFSHIDPRMYDWMWEYIAHEFYQLVLNGGDTEKFWDDLLTNKPPLHPPQEGD